MMRHYNCEESEAEYQRAKEEAVVADRVIAELADAKAKLEERVAQLESTLHWASEQLADLRKGLEVNDGGE